MGAWGVAATVARGAGANSGSPSGPISGSDSDSFFQAGRKDEELVAGLRLGAGRRGNGACSTPSRAGEPVTGGGGQW